MHIISWNVNGIRSVVTKNFFATVQALQPDILCLQETKAQEDEAQKAVESLVEYQHFFNSAERKGYSSTGLLSKITPQSLKNDMDIPEHDTEGRIQCASYDGFFLVNVYVPNSGQKLERLPYRQKWDAHFLAYLQALERIKPVIVCGDFNVAHQPIDLKNDVANYNKVAGYTQIEIDGMDNLLKHDFIDSFRHFHPDTIAYTYWSYRFKARERNSGWRIDYFLVSRSLVDRIKSVTIYSDILGSDHCPIGLEIDL